MRRLFAIPFLILAGLGQPNPPTPAVAPAAPTAPADAPGPGCFRVRLSSDADRNWTHVWSWHGQLDLTWQLGTTTIQPDVISPNTWADWDGALHGTMRLPKSIAPGQYTLDTGDGTLAITVVVPPTRKPKTIAAGRSAAAVNSAFAAGFLDVTLAPGLHEWDGPVRVPAWGRLLGYGATVRRVDNPDYNWRAIVPTGADVSVYGVTFLPPFEGQSPATGIVFHCDNPGPVGLVVADCTFADGVCFGYGPQQVLVQKNLFVGGGAPANAPSGCWRLNRFVGPGIADPLSLNSNMGEGCYAVIDNVFDGSTRGLTSASGATAAVRNNLIVGNVSTRICRTNNGNECNSCEGNFDFNLILHDRHEGNFGSSIQWDRGARYNYVRDFMARSSFGILLWGSPSGPFVNVVQEGNEFREFETTAIFCGPAARNNRFVDGSVVGFQVTRGNQTFPNKSPIALGRKVAAWADGVFAASNTLANVDVIAAPAGVVGVQGFGSAGK